MCLERQLHTLESYFLAWELRLYLIVKKMQDLEQQRRKLATDKALRKTFLGQRTSLCLLLNQCCQTSTRDVEGGETIRQDDRRESANESLEWRS